MHAKQTDEGCAVDDSAARATERPRMNETCQFSKAQDGGEIQSAPSRSDYFVAVTVVRTELEQL